MTMYDTVIIGAGMSGLAAGIRLAHFGKRVLILERHTRVGGLNSWYERGGFLIESGLHAMTNFATQGASKHLPLMKLLRQLRLRTDDLQLRPQRHSLIHFPSASLRFSNDFELLKAEISSTFPAQIDGFIKLDAMIRQYDDLSLLPTNHFQSARDVVARYITDPLLADMLFCPLSYYGSAVEDDMDFRQFVTMYKAIFAEGFGRPAAGIRGLLDLLVQRFEESGGELRLGCAVGAIREQDDSVCGVETDNGEFIPCRSVLSSAGCPETAALLPDPCDYGAGRLGFAEMVYILEDQVVAPAEETIRFFCETDRFNYRSPMTPLDFSSGVVCYPRHFALEPDDVSPPNAVRLTLLANPSVWNSADAEGYRVLKATVEPQIDHLAKRQTGIRDLESKIALRDFFTPRTIQHFTGRRNGAIYGSPSKRYDGRTGVDGVYLCGTDQGFLGIVGAMLSGISIANSYLLK